MTQPPPPHPLPPSHPQATTVLVLGILGIVVCGVIGPFAWTMGSRVVAEIDASGGRLGGRTEANVGRILGIVATALLALGLVAVFAFLVLGLAVAGGSATHG